MIFAGYRANKWVHGDHLLRAWLLMCALTGNTGREGGGVQTTQLPNGDGLMGYAFNGLGPRLNVQAISLWDYVHSDGAQMTNRKFTAMTFADHYESHHAASRRRISGYRIFRRRPGRWASWPATTRPTGVRRGKGWREYGFRKAGDDRGHDAAYEHYGNVCGLRIAGRRSL